MKTKLQSFIVELSREHTGTVIRFEETTFHEWENYIAELAIQFPDFDATIIPIVG